MTTEEANKDVKVYVWDSKTFFSTPNKELTWKDIFITIIKTVNCKK